MLMKHVIESYYYGRAKLEIALAKGKDLYDKRETEKLRDAKRAMEKALKLH